MAVFTSGGFGSGQRLSASGFVVLGLITFRVYSVLRFAASLRAHFERRWRELEARDDLKGADPARLAALRARGFAAASAAPWTAAGLFALCAILVARWFYNWILVSGVSRYATIVGTVGASSALLLMLWALGAVRRHETSELLVRETGAGALLAHGAELGDEMVAATA